MNYVENGIEKFITNSSPLQITPSELKTFVTEITHSINCFVKFLKPI